MTVLEDMFIFMNPTGDELFTFIDQVENLFEAPDKFRDGVINDFEGNPYELHLMLQSLKTGQIDFTEFMKRAMQWSESVGK